MICWLVLWRLLCESAQQPWDAQKLNLVKTFTSRSHQPQLYSVLLCATTPLQTKWLNPAFSYNGRSLSWGCFLNVVFRCGLHTYSHAGQILNWEIQTPKQFLSSPKAIFCYDTVAAAVHSVSLHGVVCGSVDVAARHSGSLFSPQSNCHALNGLRCGADCVAQGRTQDCRIVKIALLLAFLHFASS